MNDQEGNSERPGFDLGTGMMTRDIFVPDGTMKSTSRENKKHPEASTEILVLVREMVMNRRCAAVGRGRGGGYGMWYSCRGKIKHRDRHWQVATSDIFVRKVRLNRQPLKRTTTLASAAPHNSLND